LERALRLVWALNDLQSLATATGRRLDRERPAELLAEPQHLTRRGNRLRRPRDDRNASRGHALAGGGLRAHHVDRLGGWPDPDDPRTGDGAREAGVLGEEAVARMHRLSSSALGELEQPLLGEVTLQRQAR